MRHILVAVVTAGVATAAPSATGKSSPLPRLFIAAEEAQVKAALKKRLVATKSCPRPVLRGTATKGNATPKLLALFSGKDACSARIDKLVKRTDDIASIPAADADLVAYETACGAALATAVTAIASHESVCSPYELGIREIKTVDRQTAVGTLLAHHIRAVGKTDPVAALRLALDGIRMFHDVTRGHAAASTFAIAWNGSQQLAAAARHVLDAAPAGARPQLAALVPELDALIASAPTAHAMLVNEGDSLALYEMQTAATRSPLDRNAAIDKRDDLALGLHLGIAVDASIVHACPPAATYAACRTSINAVPNQSSFADGAVATLMTTPGASRQTTREAIIAVMRDQVFASLPKIIDSGALALLDLASLRIQLEATTTRTCPTAKTLDKAPWVTLRVPAMLGFAMKLTFENDTVTTELPDVLTRHPVTFTFRCPAT